MHHGLIAVEQPRFHPVTFAGGVHARVHVCVCVCVYTRVTTHFQSPLLLFSPILKLSSDFVEEIKEETQTLLYRIYVMATNDV